MSPISVHFGSVNRLPVLARRPRRVAAWWRPGLPVHPPEHEDLTIAELVLAADRECWHRRPADDLEPEDGAMRWTPDQPTVRF